MNSSLTNILPNPLPSNANELMSVLRETMQSLALLGLWRGKFFENAAFYGGTALRILYNLDRYSEDLDFSLLKPSNNFSFNKYESSLKKELNAFGFDVSFEVKNKTVKTDIESAFLKSNTINQLISIKVPENIIAGINKNSILKIKLEIDTNPPANFGTETKYIFSPIQFAVRSYNLPSLFAGKMHAILFRKWKTRVKGRDWYDFVWYVSKYPELNLLHLEERMKQSNDLDLSDKLTKAILLTKINNTIEQLDIEKAKKEVEPFLKDKRSIEIWSKDFFRAAAEKIVIIS